LAITGCGGGGSSDAGGETQANNGRAASTSANQAELPADLFVAEAPAKAPTLLDAKSAAAVGDEIAFEARIGGRPEPFTESAAVFLVADRAILTCDERHGDGCPTPWDFCCEPKDNLLKNMATVQIVDADGRPLRGSAKGSGGLEPQAKIVVVGTVAQIDGPSFVVNATRIYVEPA